MGGSALRAMAFGRPVIVQGERGFWELLTPETAAGFLWTGWYGVGDGSEHGPPKLEALLRGLLEPDRRARLGGYARSLVTERFALQPAAVRQLQVYAEAVASPPTSRRQRIAGGGASARALVAYKVRRRLDGLLGASSLDDFNSRPVAAASTIGR
jgi:hypothetical protein